MSSWIFVILWAIIINTAKGDVCGDRRIFGEQSLENYCRVEEHSAQEDIEDERARAANVDYTNCVRAYGYIAVIDNPNVPGISCISAIISNLWLMDNCIENPGFYYRRIKIGAMMNPPNIREYRIVRTIAHANYSRVGFTKEHYRGRHLFAATDSLILRKANTRMLMPSGVCPIGIYRSTNLPTCATYAVYINQGYMRSTVMPTTSPSCCNYHYRDYFYPGPQVCLSKRQYCASTRRITPDQCCQSQAFMIYRYTLLGVMSWSTGCSSRFGIDPWVFSNVARYVGWIRQWTNIRF